MTLLSVDTNAKTIKGQFQGYLTGILYLAPAGLSGRQVCAHRSNGCEIACLYSAGRGAFTNVQAARMRKTLAFFKDKDGFIAELKADIFALVKKAKKAGMLPCVRLTEQATSLSISSALWNLFQMFLSMIILRTFPA